MAVPRKLFSQLSESQQTRKLSWYRRNQGLSPSQVASRYNAGTLGSQKAARGKAHSPEHPKDAVKNPGKYHGYTPQKAIRVTPQEDARLTETAVRNMERKLAPGLSPSTTVFNFSPERVRDNVDRMSPNQKIWTSNATEDELIEAARRQVAGNLWWYH